MPINITGMSKAHFWTIWKKTQKWTVLWANITRENLFYLCVNSHFSILPLSQTNLHPHDFYPACKCIAKCTTFINILDGVFCGTYYRASHFLNTWTIIQFYIPKAYLEWINPDCSTFFLLNIPDFMRYKTMVSRSILVKLKQCEEGLK